MKEFFEALILVIIFFAGARIVSIPIAIESNAIAAHVSAGLDTR